MMKLRLRRLLEELADPDGSNPYTAAASASSSAASAAADRAATAASVHGAASAACVGTASAACVGRAASAASVSAPSGGKLYAGPMCSSVFLVEDIEGRQTDVRDFLLSKEYRCGVLSRYIAS
jgi:hypothetical protein